MAFLVGVDEVWAAVPGFPSYEVSSHGRVRKAVNCTHRERRQHRTLRQSIDKDGYFYLSLGTGHRWRVHRLVYMAFCGKLEAGLVICHLDGNRQNNTPDNLSQETQRVNISHKVQHGTAQVGQKHGRAIYSDSQAKSVHDMLSACQRYLSGKLIRGSISEIAAACGVSKVLVRDMSAGKTWRHVA